MSERNERCDQIAEWLVESGAKETPEELEGHVDTCAVCREQIWIHESLVASFAEQEVPRLSAAFKRGLDKKLAAARVDVRPLTGWRLAAMLGYAAVAIRIAGWLLRNVPLPTIDTSAPWLAVMAFGAVPLTFMLAIAASRWLPTPKRRPGPLALGL